MRWGWVAITAAGLAGCANPEGWLEPQVTLLPPEPAEVTVAPGGFGAAELRLEPAPGLAEALAPRAELSAKTPPGVAVVLSPALATPGESVELRLEASPGARPGRYEVQIFATTPYQTVQTTLRMVIP